MVGREWCAMKQRNASRKKSIVKSSTTSKGCTTFRPGHSGPLLSGPLLLGLNVAKIGPERRTWMSFRPNIGNIGNIGQYVNSAGWRTGKKEDIDDTVCFRCFFRPTNDERPSEVDARYCERNRKRGARYWQRSVIWGHVRSSTHTIALDAVSQAFFDSLTNLRNPVAFTDWCDGQLDSSM
jgi:hypothetical protein